MKQETINSYFIIHQKNIYKVYIQLFASMRKSFYNINMLYFHVCYLLIYSHRKNNFKNIKKVVDKYLKLKYTKKVERTQEVGAQLSWESICLTSRGSQVRALQRPPLIAVRQFSWLECQPVTLEVEGSSPFQVAILFN